MRTTKHIGILTLKTGEMLEIEYAEYEKIVQSFAKSELGKVYIPSLRRGVDKTYIVDFSDKWIEDRNAVIVEERPANILAEGAKIEADGNGPGYKKFMEMREKLRRKLGPSSR